MGVTDLTSFGLVIGAAAFALLLAIAVSRVSVPAGIPAPAIFLVLAAAAAGIFPQLATASWRTDQRVVTVALIIILFDGGMSIGRERFRRAAWAVLWLGVAGTIVTAGGTAVAAHVLFGFDWRTSLLIGTVLAPTDPAVVFSVLGGREIGGRTVTILEGESGANDPVGIALLVSLLGAGGGGAGAVMHGAATFGVAMLVGVIGGLAGGFVLAEAMRRLSPPKHSQYPLNAIAGAAAIYGLTTAAHGSGFLAVFVAGIHVGDIKVPYRAEINRFTSTLASLGEIVAFTILGLTVNLRDLAGGRSLVIGLGLAALLMLVIRPVLVGLILAPISLRRPERLFVLWAGLKGAVPILLATFLIGSGVRRAGEAYQVVFVVVVASVVIQGSSVPMVARRLRIPMRTAPALPFTAGLRLRSEAAGVHRLVVGSGSRAEGSRVEDLPLGAGGWLSMISRDGEWLQLGPDTCLRAGDAVLVQAEVGFDVAAVFKPA